MRKLAIIWLAVFTIGCILHSIYIIVYEGYGDRGLVLAFAIPFFHTFALIFIFVMSNFISIIFRGRPLQFRNNEHLKRQYGHIYDQMYPSENASDPADKKENVSLTGRIVFFWGICYLVLFFLNFKCHWLEVKPWVMLVGFFPFILIGAAVTQVVLTIFIRLFFGKEAKEAFLNRLRSSENQASKEESALKPVRQQLFASKAIRQAHKDFMKGRLDDGTDRKLNGIRLNMKLDGWIMGWAFLLVPAIWIFNGILILFFHGPLSD